MLAPELTERLGQLTDLGAVGALLGWDQQTLMPPGGAQARGEVMATLAGLAHERQTADVLGLLLREARPEGALEQAVVRVARRDHDKARRVPARLSAEIELASALAQEPWAHARATNDWAHFRPFVERNLELRREYAACFREATHPYDALLDGFEPGLTTARVREVFAQLRPGLVALVAELAAAPSAPVLPGPFPVAAQEALALELARSFGWSEQHWRMDHAVHPFAQSLNAHDIRVTARYAPEDLQGLFAVMHEMGHGLYEHQIDPALARTTLGTGASYAVHESQARLWENQVGRSEPFWRHWLPRLRKEFAQGLGGLSDRDVLRAINRVEPSLIRVDADEVTYCLHIILRFELELALVEGELSAAELPAAWNAKMRELLGVEVPDDAHGVLQDVHWAFGEFGYFPSYAIGTIAAAQLWDALRRDVPDLDDQLAEGRYAPLREWLREHVHRHGRTLDSDDLLRRATGGGLDAAPLVAQLTTKYRALYSS